MSHAFAVPGDGRLQVGDVDEVVRLPPQLVVDHGRLRTNGGDHRHSHALSLASLHQPAEVTVTGEKDDVLHVGGHLEHVDGQLNVHVALDAAAAAVVGEFLH